MNTDSDLFHSQRVYLQQLQDYSEKSIISFVEESFKDLSPFQNLRKKVLVKPNLIFAKGGGLGCTDPRFIVALCCWLKSMGATVYLGDSPAFGKARTALNLLGIEKKLTALGVHITEFETAVKRKLSCGVEIGVAKEALDCDILINVPKVKSHQQMYVTLGVKNIFGIVKGMRKSLLHMVHGGKNGLFIPVLLDLLQLLPPSIHIVDGIVAMHRGGPIHGEPFDLKIAGFSTNVIALDTAILEVLGGDFQSSPLWCEAAKRKLVGYDIEHLQFPMQKPVSLRKNGFVAPAELSPVRFNPINFISGNIKRLGLKIAGK